MLPGLPFQLTKSELSSHRSRFGSLCSIHIPEPRAHFVSYALRSCPFETQSGKKKKVGHIDDQIKTVNPLPVQKRRKMPRPNEESSLLKSPGIFSRLQFSENVFSRACLLRMYEPKPPRDFPSLVYTVPGSTRMSLL